jgi:hypothetical protein
MAYYAFLDENNIVTEVISGVDETNTDNLPEGFNSWEDWYSDFKGQTCKRTSYNTKSNQHINDGSPFRGNFAGIGYTYDEVNDVFYEPQPYPSWTLDENWMWQPPVAYPSDNAGQLTEHFAAYSWDEDTLSWVLLEE